MPLYLRAAADHYPDRAAHAPLEVAGRYVVLSGCYHAGNISPSKRLHQEHRLDWGGGFAEFWTGGTVDSVDHAKAAIAAAFRDGIARVGATERPDARPGPPERDPKPAPVDAKWATELPSSDHDNPIAIHTPRHFRVYAGELMLGNIAEANRVPHVGWWSWSMDGLRQRPADVPWRGATRSAETARDEIEAYWRAWLAWAGLAQKEPVRWISR